MKRVRFQLVVLVALLALVAMPGIAADGAKERRDGAAKATDASKVVREILLSYSRSKGVFAGIALDGSKIMVDRDRNRAFYGADATAEQILRGDARPAPQFVKDLSAIATTLGRYSTPKPDTAR